VNSAQPRRGDEDCILSLQGGGRLIRQWCESDALAVLIAEMSPLQKRRAHRKVSMHLRTRPINGFNHVASAL